MTIRDIIIKYSQELEKISDTPRLDVELFLQKALGGVDRIYIHLNLNKELTTEQYDEFIEYIKEGSVEDITEKRAALESNKIGNIKKMYKVSDESSEIKMEEVAFDKASLNSNDAFLIDRGDVIFVWVGKGASKNEKRFSIVFGQKYMKLNIRPLCIPIITIQEGMLEQEIDKCFK